MTLSLLLALAALAAAGGAAPVAKPACPIPSGPVQLPAITESGYLQIDAQGSKLFFVYSETSSSDSSAPLPITLWLQGGPGCSSLFGAFYELGPQLVDEDLGLQANPGSWARRSALLFIDQPLGTGFSVAGGNRTVPTDEMTLAADLYAALQAFFKDRPKLQSRPFIIAGESYGGKYVPSLGHFILSQAATLGGARSLGHLRGTPNRAARLAALQRRPLPPRLAAERPLLREAPLFDLRGLAIGNGLTDPAAQVQAVADAAFFQGYIDEQQRLHASTLQLETVQLIAVGRWEAAHAMRNRVLGFVQEAAGAATLLDIRRYEDYDARKLVDCYLNLPAVQEALGVEPVGTRYEACSAAVGSALGPDVMQSVKRLVPDLLEAYPVLLYQGAHDAQDGPASNEAWMAALEWEGSASFAAAKRHIIRARDVRSEASWHADDSSGSGMSSGGSGSHLLLLGQPRSSSGGSTPVPAGRPAQQRRLLVHNLAAGTDGGGEQLARGAAAGARNSGGRKPAGNPVVAYWKQGGGLTHVVLTDAGHMAPRDAPEATQWMFERWAASVSQAA